MGVITMKMIRSTSITSTMGVTLMSATIGGAFFSSIKGAGTTGFQLASFLRLACPGALRPLQEVVDQLGAGVAHLDVERFDPVREVVVHPHGRDGHKQTDGGGYQR